MALQDLNRTSDTTGDGLTAIAKPTTNRIADITPKNWRRFPPVAGSTVKVYVPVFTYNGGLIGDDVDVAESNVLIDDRGVGDYGPRTQVEKAAAMVPPGSLAVDVTRARGWIAPNQPYQGNAAVPVAPVISSLSPNTAAAGVGQALVVDITGTGFTPWSSVLSGNYPVPSVYISPTLIRIAQFPKNSVAGTVQVVVIDHDMNSAPSNFVFT
jgi:hypothetical protein